MTRSDADLVVFDWDGTLMDSTAKICHCLQSAAMDCDVPDPGLDACRQIIGLGLAEAIAELFPRESATRHHALSERYRWHFLDGPAWPTPLFPEVEEGLRRMVAAGYRLAIATGKSRRGLERVLQESKTAHLFVASRCADESASKPDPRMLNELLAETGVSAERAAMVGDTTYDMEMAAQAGVRGLAVTYGAHPRSQLLTAAPSACLDSFGAVCAWFGV